MFKFIGDPVISFIADSTDAKTVFIITMLMQILTLEILRLVQPLTYNIIFLVKILRTSTAPSSTLTTTASFKLTEGSSQGFGQQRMFGSLAWGSGAFIAGFLIDEFGMNSIFYYTYFFQILSLIFVVYGLPSKFTKSSVISPSTSNQDLNIDDSHPLMEKGNPSNSNSSSTTNSSTSFVSYFCGFLLENKKLQELMHFLKNSQCRIVLLNAFFYGIIVTVSDTYLYISLEKDYDASRTFSGLCTTMATMSCLPLFWYSEYFIRRFGHHNMMFFAQCVGAVRIAIYALILIIFPLHSRFAAYAIVVSQLMHGCSYALYLAAAVDMMFKLAPKELSVSSLSVLNVVFLTLSAALGNFFWGFVYDYAGGIFSVYVISSLLCFANACYFGALDEELRQSNLHNHQAPLKIASRSSSYDKEDAI